jgi:hypothetical protein
MSDKLIEQGIDRFLDAQYALNRFKVKITSIARGVLQRNHLTLSKTLKVKPPAIENIALEGPEDLDADYDGEEAWLGVSLWFDKPVSGYIELGVQFARKGRPEINLIVCHQQQTKRTYTALRDAFSKSRDVIFDQPAEKEIGFLKPLTRSTDIEAELQEIMEKMIQFWKDNGGWAKVVS